MKHLEFLLIAMRSLAILAVVLTLGGSALSADKKENVLYSFQGGSDGAFPPSGLIADQSGNLYGTTTFGGAVCGNTSCGTVFKLTPPAALGGMWTESVLYAFQGYTDGGGPRGGLTFDKTGNLYGTTFGGGQNAACGNCGTIFQLTPPSAPGGNWTEHVLHRFQDDPDGALPWGGMIFDRSGNLFGTTYSGGPYGVSGTVFQLTPPAVPGGDWTESVIHSFDWADPGEGYNPLSSLTMDKAGDIYGTTESGGIFKQGGVGTVFKLTSPATTGGAWSYRVLHRFQGSPADGAFPIGGLVFDELGNVYGTTESGGGKTCKYFGSTTPCGTVFQLTPPFWTETVIHNFAGGSDGFNPQGGLAFHNGSLYGTTVQGGGCATDGGCGTIFQLTPAGFGGGTWTETVLYRFRGGSDGEWPIANPLFGSRSVLYSTTSAGGGTATCSDTYTGCGTVLELVP